MLGTLSPPVPPPTDVDLAEARRRYRESVTAARRAWAAFVATGLEAIPPALRDNDMRREFRVWDRLLCDLNARRNDAARRVKMVIRRMRRRGV